MGLKYTWYAGFNFDGDRALATAYGVVKDNIFFNVYAAILDVDKRPPFQNYGPNLYPSARANALLGDYILLHLIAWPGDYTILGRESGNQELIQGYLDEIAAYPSHLGALQAISVRYNAFIRDMYANIPTRIKAAVETELAWLQNKDMTPAEMLQVTDRVNLSLRANWGLDFSSTASSIDDSIRAAVDAAAHH